MKKRSKSMEACIRKGRKAKDEAVKRMAAEGIPVGPVVAARIAARKAAHPAEAGLELRRALLEAVEHLHFLEDTLIPDMEADMPDSAHLVDHKTSARLIKALARAHLAPEVPRP